MDELAKPPGAMVLLPRELAKTVMYWVDRANQNGDEDLPEFFQLRAILEADQPPAVGDIPEWVTIQIQQNTIGELRLDRERLESRIAELEALVAEHRDAPDDSVPPEYSGEEDFSQREHSVKSGISPVSPLINQNSAETKS